MKQYIVYMDCNLVGCEDVGVLEMHDDHTQDQLDDAVWEMALDYGNSWQPDDMEWEEFEQSISAHAEPYNPDKHDGDRAGGGSFKNDFRSLRG